MQNKRTPVANASAIEFKFDWSNLSTSTDLTKTRSVNLTKKHNIKKGTLYFS